MESSNVLSLTQAATGNNAQRRLLLAASYASLFLGSVSSSLLSRFYFVHGGSSRCVSTLVQSAGFLLLLLPISLSPPCHRPFSNFTLKLFFYSILMGLFLGINNLFISWGVSFLPVSTSSLLLSSQLAFNLVLSILLVNQRVTFTNLNCVVLLTLSSIVLALGANSDRPAGVTRAQFFLGFLATLAAAGMFALYLPIMEIVYRGVKTFKTVVEMQFLMEVAATGFALVGMACDKGFAEMGMEGKAGFDLGEAKYWVTIVGTAVTWQICFMATAGMVFLTSSLKSGICMTALLSVNVVAGVVAFKDKFGGLKAVALGLCLWGFASYLYGEYKKEEEKKRGERADDSIDGKEMNTV